MLVVVTTWYLKVGFYNANRRTKKESANILNIATIILGIAYSIIRWHSVTKHQLNANCHGTLS
jgi:putative Mn2+ efflux pump MntP